MVLLDQIFLDTDVLAVKVRLFPCSLLELSGGVTEMTCEADDLRAMYSQRRKSNCEGLKSNINACREARHCYIGISLF